MVKQPKFGTQEYATSILNPLRRPLICQHMDKQTIKIALALIFGCFAVMALTLADRGAQGVSFAVQATLVVTAITALQIEFLVRIFALGLNMIERMRVDARKKN